MWVNTSRQGLVVRLKAGQPLAAWADPKFSANKKKTAEATVSIIWKVKRWKGPLKKNYLLQ